MEEFLFDSAKALMLDGIVEAKAIGWMGIFLSDQWLLLMILNIDLFCIGLV